MRILKTPQPPEPITTINSVHLVIESFIRLFVKQLKKFLPQKLYTANAIYKKACLDT